MRVNFLSGLKRSINCPVTRDERKNRKTEKTEKTEKKITEKTEP
jgi:hypothetical protein